MANEDNTGLSPAQIAACERQERRHIVVPTIWTADRISDDRTVEDRIHNAVLSERERCARIVEEYPDCGCETCCKPQDDIAEKIRSGQ